MTANSEGSYLEPLQGFSTSATMLDPLRSSMVTETHISNSLCQSRLQIFSPTVYTWEHMLRFVIWKKIISILVNILLHHLPSYILLSNWARLSLSLKHPVLLAPTNLDLEQTSLSPLQTFSILKTQPQYHLPTNPAQTISVFSDLSIPSGTHSHRTESDSHRWAFDYNLG